MGELHLIRVERNRRTEMEAFLSGLNLSMLNRANDDPRIPYKAMSEQELIRELDEGYSTYILNEDEEVVGGGQ